MLSAALGPEIVKRTQGAFAPYLVLGTDIGLAASPVLHVALLAFARLPPPPPRGRPSSPQR